MSRHTFLVVILGPDGAGKTTLAENLLNSVTVSKLFVKQRYLHTKFPTLPPLHKVADKACPRKIHIFGTGSRVTPRTLEPLSKIMSTGYVLYYGLSYCLGHIWLLKAASRNGYFLVFDRYFYEYFVQQQFVNSPRGLLELLLKMIPVPDAVIFLHDLPETINKRKAELPVEIIREQLRSYELFLQDRKFNTVSIDTSKGVCKTYDTALTFVLEALISKYKGV
jgi:thymidylate kinase